MAYLLVALMPSLASFTGLTRMFSGALSHGINSLALYVIPYTNITIIRDVAVVASFLTAIALIVAKITIFQDGYNEYQN